MPCSAGRGCSSSESSGAIGAQTAAISGSVGVRPRPRRIVAAVSLFRSGVVVEPGTRRGAMPSAVIDIPSSASTRRPYGRVARRVGGRCIDVEEVFDVIGVASAEVFDVLGSRHAGPVVVHPEPMSPKLNRRRDGRARSSARWRPGRPAARRVPVATASTPTSTTRSGSGRDQPYDRSRPAGRHGSPPGRHGFRPLRGRGADAGRRRRRGAGRFRDRTGAVRRPPAPAGTNRTARSHRLHFAPKGAENWQPSGRCGPSVH
jgi:hypothetical protein